MGPRQGGTCQCSASKPCSRIMTHLPATVDRRNYSDFVRNLIHVFKFLYSNLLSHMFEFKPFLLAIEKLKRLLHKYVPFRVKCPHYLAETDARAKGERA